MLLGERVVTRDIASAPNVRVSVVIAAYNSTRFLAETLASVLAEVDDRDEIIVVDDGSTDGTADLVRTYPRVRLIQQDNAGPPAARNTAIRAALGEFIATIDHDDLWPSGRLDLMLAALDRTPSAAYVAGEQVLVLEPGAPLPFWLRSADPDELVRFRRERGNGVMLTRRNAFDRVGLFDESFTRGGEDIDWILRCVELGLEAVEIDDAVLLRRIHGGNITSDRENMQRSTFAVLRKRAQRRRAQ